MEITEVRIKRFEDPQGKLMGFASVTFDGCFVVHNLRIVSGEKGVFVAMPSRQLPNNKFVDVAHPVTNEMRAKIQQAVLRQFEQTKSDPPKETPPPAEPSH
ncbi:MAG: septation protein SpoVG [Candidatus Lindowbacteria bacterium RIFCSPLOWO2_12_FULL_62_27]|nr:MAG: septation protein SpoVG [Candidatus Lindowbacteria bacterium RIFCSPLOWO2_12_FULL_62_27]OGH63764.1 MAG: septation protein SpoVG [Candidatus Lindowbacteria bacterium RIFCSPLOWO2_02_FULL_62_12]